MFKMTKSPSTTCWR